MYKYETTLDLDMEWPDASWTHPTSKIPKT